MATQRIESGQMQIRSVGSVPMVQAQQQSVDYIGPRVAAQGAGQLAQVLDRMSASAFQMAGTLRQQEGLQYVASNPPSAEQLEAAKNGVTIGLGGRGETSSIGSTGSLNIFDQAVAKARSLELSGHFEIEGRNELVKLLSGVENGSVTSEQVSAKIKTMSDGFSKSLSSIDPEASIKFRATMATHGNTVLNAAYKAELERSKNQRIALFDSDFDTSLRLLEATISQGSWYRGTGQRDETGTEYVEQRSIDELADVFRKNVLNQSLLLGDKALQNGYSTKFEVGLRNAKINAVTKALMSDANMVDPERTLAKLKAGDLGNMSPVLQSMITNDFESVAKVTANFMVAVNNRKSIKDAKIADEKRVTEGQAINLLEQIFPLPENSPKRKALISELIALPPGSVPIGILKDVLEPKPAKEAESNQGILFNLVDGIYNNTITDSSQIKALIGKGITGKDGVSLLKLLQSDNKSDSSQLERGISQLAGIPVISGSVVVLDPKGDEFKRRKELQAEAFQIQSAAALEGKTLMPRQILTQLEDNIAKRRSSADAQAAQKALAEFAKGPDGKYKSGRDWITGPVTEENLPALRQKAGNDAAKMRQIIQLEELLKRARGN
jgi:hypothetical protein